jgi:hypothetical protein
VSPDLYDFSHHLAGEVAGLGGTYRSYGFEQIRDTCSLYRQHGNVADSFRRRGSWLAFAGTAAETGNREQHQR